MEALGAAARASLEAGARASLAALPDRQGWPAAGSKRFQQLRRTNTWCGGDLENGLRVGEMVRGKGPKRSYSGSIAGPSSGRRSYSGSIAGPSSERRSYSGSIAGPSSERRRYDIDSDTDSSDEWLPPGSSSSGESPKKNRKKGCAARRLPSSEKDAGWGHGDWQPTKVPFSATPGPRDAAEKLESDLPVDFLELVITDELLQHIADQTNLYAEQFFRAHPDTLPHSRGRLWEPVGVRELKRFFGLTFITGYLKKPSLEMYWSVDQQDASPFFNRTMPRNRFQLIWRFLHYNDNATPDATDKMYKVRPVLDHLVGKFKELYQPSENICIDEGMMQWRGRLSFKVYNPQKPVKYGIKLYILCDSRTGYCFNMRPYIGQSNPLPDTVFTLLDRLRGHGYTLYMDNYYNSVKLCEQLVKAGTNVCGTLRKNRGEPQIIREPTRAELGVEGRLVRHKGGVMVMAWQDKRVVRMVTTCHRDSMQRVEVWQKGENKKVGQLKPECVVAYNACMNGVDKLDQNIAYYPFIRKTLNWSKKFVAYLFQLCVFNAYVLYKARNPGKCNTHLAFVKSVARSWTEKTRVEEEEEEDHEAEYKGRDDVDVDLDEKENEGVRQISAPRKRDPDSRLDGLMARHQLERLRPTGSGTPSARKCRVCIRRSKRSETRWMCRSCKVPLHAGECYTDYHTRENYRLNL